MIPYTYEIISVDPQSRVMEVVYSSAGRQSMHMGVRLPFVGETLEAVIDSYSPVPMWMEQDREVMIPQVGITGALDGSMTGGDLTVEPASVRLTALEFMERFTDAEQLAITQASLANAQIRAWYDKLIAANYVDFDDPRLTEGLNALVATGLLASERVAEVTAPPSTGSNTVVV